MTVNQIWAYQPESFSVELKTVALPSLNKGEVLVKNHAIGINPVDWKFINMNPLAWPQNHVPGVDGAGEIVAVADEADAHLIGKRVAYHTFLKTDGSFASHSVLKTERFMLLPDAMSYAVAASLPCPMLTAYQAFEKIPLRQGADVLIAGLGAVTRVLVQLLVQAGLNVDVISTYCSEQEAKALGVRHVYRDKSAIEQQYFAAFDTMGEPSAISLVKHLKANGHIICILSRIETPVDPAFTRTISYHEIALGALHEFGDKAAWLDLMQNGERVLADIVQAKVSIEQPVEFPFVQMQQALVHSETTRAKTVVMV